MDIPDKFRIIDTDSGAKLATGTADTRWVSFTYTDGTSSDATALPRPDFEAVWAGWPQFRHMRIEADA